MLGKILAGVVGGLILAGTGGSVVLIAAASGPDPVRAGAAGAIAFFVVWVAGLMIAIFAPRPGKAWRRLLIVSGIVTLCLPLASFVFTGGQIAEAGRTGGEYAGAAMAGAAMGGGLVTLVAGFFGFFFGAVLLVIGLLVGRDPQVVYMQQPPTSPEGGAAT